MESENRSMTASVIDANDRMVAVYFCFFLSSFAALIYELSWQRMLLRILGSTLPSVTIILCVFMTGLAFGCWLAGRFADRSSNPLLAYGLMELIVGIFGVFSPWLFSSHSGSVLSGYDAWATHLFSLSNVDSFEPFNSLFWCRAFFASILLLIPTSAMGATLPFVTRFLQQTAGLNQNQNRAYLCNLSGAAAGTICSGFVLMPYLGLNVAIYVASCLSVSVLVVILTRCLRIGSSADIPSAVWRGDRSVYPVALAVLINGAVSMILEVIWSRLFSLLVGSSTYSIASVFAVSIVGLAVGTSIFGRLSLRIKSHRTVMALMFCVIAGCLYLNLWLIQLLPWFFNVNHEFFAGINSYSAYLFERITVISLLVLPTAIFCGSIFPLALGEISERNEQNAGLPLLYTCSSVGSVVGAASAGFVFIPLLGRMFSSGMESTICLVIVVEILFAVYLLVCSNFKSKFVLFAIPLGLGALLFWRPAWNRSLISSGLPFLSLPTKATTTKEIFDRILSDSVNNKLLFYREGLNTTVTVSANLPQNVVYLKNDGKVEAALPFNTNRPADTSDLITHSMLGRLPVSLNAATEQDVFVVGLGSGATCGAALQSSSVKRLKVAEVEPTIFEIQHYFEPANGEPTRPAWLKDGRVVPFCGDARMSLNFSKEKYDVIISQPAEPWISGSADLYTTEFWSVARAKLKDGGFFCQWIQLYAIDPEFLAVLLRTFQDVFPNTYVYHYPRAGEIILLGSLKPLDPVLAKRDSSLIAGPDQVRNWCEIIGRRANNLRLNTDDNLLTEYALPQRLYLSENLIEENLQSIMSVR
ncbi:MAG: hypothetical protein EKK48_28250 [Candidatus Melainabacteria bacterium]|nr:MAG: hypothetical protein EKK48_28250 [Candidatus Melainabacteria bacterium]